MSLLRALDISASGLYAGRLRMDVIAQNIANAESETDGATPYRRREVILVSRPSGPNSSFGPPRQAAQGGVAVLGIREDTSPPQLVYRPGDPQADAQGYVRLPNVNLPLEMVDMVTATRIYEANAAALKTARDMVKRTLDIMR